MTQRPIPQPELSVIVCTYNRCANLPDCIAHLARQTHTEGLDWEVLVVDNNSTDATRSTVEDLRRHYPGLRMRYVFEAEQGLSAARNRGIADTHSRYILFIDDDIRVSNGWLRAMYDAIAEHDADAVGGRIHLDNPAELPAWIRPDMYGFLGYQDFGPTARGLDGRKEFPFGGNMGFNRRVMDNIGLFDTSYGLKGAGNRREELLKGEETNYFRRLHDAGGRIAYAPGGLVFHHFDPTHVHKQYFRTIHFNQGYLDGAKDQQPHRRRLFGVPWFIYTQTGRSVIKYLGLLIGRGPNHAFRQQMNISYFLGVMTGYYNARQKLS